MSAFDPACFFTELPVELTRHIVHFATRSREGLPRMQPDHSDMAGVVTAYERDQRVLSALRATNKGQPFRPNLPGNRMNYYELTHDIWRMRKLVFFRLKLLHDMPTKRHQRHTLYNQMWHTLHGHTLAIRAAVGEDPDALKRALRKLKASRERELLSQSAQARNS